jgi:broad specificity phosphatase PhoE
MEEKTKLYCTFYIVRHGETDWNVDHRVQGHTDIVLNATGELQAQMAGNLLKDIHFDAVYSSDLVRAQRTAEIIALDRALEIQTTQLLREQHFGKFEGTLWTETSQLFDARKRLSEEELLHHRIADEETHHEVITRLFTFLREASLTHRGQTILVVAHGGLMRHLLARLGKGSLKHPKFMKNTGYIKLRSDGIEFFLDEVNGVDENR